MTEMGPRRAPEEPMVPSLVSGAPTAQPLVSVPWTVPLPERQPPPQWLPSVAIVLLLATPSAMGTSCPFLQYLARRIFSSLLRGALSS